MNLVREKVFFAEFSHVDGVCFPEYLNWFAQSYPEQLHLIQVDNGCLHTFSELELPDNVVLLFQPPYSLEVNPIERLWKEIKKELKWECFDSLEQLKAVCRIIKINDRKHCISDRMGIYIGGTICSKHLSISYYN